MWTSHTAYCTYIRTLRLLSTHKNVSHPLWWQLFWLWHLPWCCFSVWQCLQEQSQLLDDCNIVLLLSWWTRSVKKIQSKLTANSNTASNSQTLYKICRVPLTLVGNGTVNNYLISLSWLYISKYCTYLIYFTCRAVTHLLVANIPASSSKTPTKLSGTLM